MKKRHDRRSDSDSSNDFLTTCLMRCSASCGRSCTVQVQGRTARQFVFVSMPSGQSSTMTGSVDFDVLGKPHGRLCISLPLFCFRAHDAPMVRKSRRMFPTSQPLKWIIKRSPGASAPAHRRTNHGRTCACSSEANIGCYARAFTGTNLEQRA